MNRRAFLAASLLALAGPRSTLAVTPVAAPAFATRVFEAIEPAPADPERIVARIDRLTDASPPFPSNLDELIELGHFEYLGAMRGEYYVGEVEAVSAPDGLAHPAQFADFVSTAGVAAFRQEHTLGMVEADSFRWTLQATGGSRKARIQLVTDLALLLAERRPGGTPAPVGDALTALLPVPQEFAFPVRVTEESPAR
jgi:hypothetical protein